MNLPYEHTLARGWKRGLGILLVAAFLAGCAGDEREGGDGAPSADDAEKEEVLEAYAEFQSVILLVDAKGWCDLLAAERLREVEEQPQGHVDCETAASLALGSFSDEEREAVRSAQDKSGLDDVEIDGKEATVTTPSGNEVPFRLEDGEWKLDLELT
jgi:hypothetical protein